jgi:hypothetical protein
VDEVAGVNHREWPARLNHLGQVVPLDVFHRKYDAFAEPDGRVRGDDVLVLQLGGRLDLAEETVTHAGSLDKVAANDLEHLRASHELIPCEVDHAHTAAPQLTEDFVIREVGHVRRQCSHRSGCR